MSQTAGFPQASPGQFQPAYTQAPPGQPLSTPQAQVQPGQYYVQPGQQIQVVVQQAQPGQRPKRGRSTTPPTTAYWKSAFIADKLIEFVSTVPFCIWRQTWKSSTNYVTKPENIEQISDPSPIGFDIEVSFH